MFKLKILITFVFSLILGLYAFPEGDKIPGCPYTFPAIMCSNPPKLPVLTNDNRAFYACDVTTIDIENDNYKGLMIHSPSHPNLEFINLPYGFIKKASNCIAHANPLLKHNQIFEFIAPDTTEDIIFRILIVNDRNENSYCHAGTRTVTYRFAGSHCHNKRDLEQEETVAVEVTETQEATVEDEVTVAEEVTETQEVTATEEATVMEEVTETEEVTALEEATTTEEVTVMEEVTETEEVTALEAATTTEAVVTTEAVTTTEEITAVDEETITEAVTTTEEITVVEVTTTEEEATVTTEEITVVVTLTDSESVIDTETKETTQGVSSSLILGSFLVILSVLLL